MYFKYYTNYIEDLLQDKVQVDLVNFSRYQKT